MDVELSRSSDHQEPTFQNPHSVSTLLQVHQVQLVEVNRLSCSSDIVLDEQDFLAQNLGFFADAIEETEPFEVTSDDLEQMWTVVMELGLGVYVRYDLGRMIGNKYAIQGVHNPELWKGFVGEYMQTRNIPERVKDDREDLEHVVSRLRIFYDIVSSCFPSDALQEQLIEEDIALQCRIDRGDEVEEERRALYQRIAQFEKRRTLLNEVRENIHSGIVPPIGAINRLLGVTKAETDW